MFIEASYFGPTAALSAGQGGRAGVQQQPPLQEAGEDQVQPRHGADPLGALVSAHR